MRTLNKRLAELEREKSASSPAGPLIWGGWMLPGETQAEAGVRLRAEHPARTILLWRTPLPAEPAE